MENKKFLFGICKRFVIATILMILYVLFLKVFMLTVYPKLECWLDKTFIINMNHAPAEKSGLLLKPQWSPVPND
jgi:hypothetical protein